MFVVWNFFPPDYWLLSVYLHAVHSESNIGQGIAYIWTYKAYLLAVKDSLHPQRIAAMLWALLKVLLHTSANSDWELLIHLSLLTFEIEPSVPEFSNHWLFNPKTPLTEMQVCAFTDDGILPPFQETYGDITGRLLLREKLKCQSFSWYLKNIYPDLHIPEDRAGWHGAVSVCYTSIQFIFNAVRCAPYFISP